MNREEDLSLVYGRHACLAILQQRPRSVRSIWLQSGRDDERSDLSQAAADCGASVHRVGVDELDRLCGGGVHQGICIKAVPRSAEGEDALWRYLADADKAPLVLVLDGIQDPRNLGACIRTAEAAGVLAVVTPRDKAAPLTAVARKAAVGAAERMPLVRVGNLARCLDTLADHGVWRVGAAGEGDVELTDVDFKVPTALVMGAEGCGLRRLTRERCDLLTRIPLVGLAGSLNVSVAAGVLLFEAARQRSVESAAT